MITIEGDHLHCVGGAFHSMITGVGFGNGGEVGVGASLIVLPGGAAYMLRMLQFDTCF